jgi:GntR family transcriptional regulator
MIDKTQSTKNIIPLYNRIEALLRNKILSRKYSPGEKLPSEDELLHHFGVSKITIRKALSRLETEGLIIRLRGKGTFVSEKIPLAKQFIFTGGVHNIVLDAERYQVHLRGMETVNVGDTRIPREIQEFLGCTSDDKISWIRRVRLLNDTPIYFLENFIPLEISQHLTQGELSEKPLLKILKNKIGLTVTRGEMYIEAVPAEPDIAEILHVQTFDPLIFMQIYYWFGSNKPLEVINSFMRAEYFKYKVDLDAKGFENI